MVDPVSALPGAASGGAGAAAHLSPLVLDGTADGGGQWVRSALTLSMCTGRPFQMHHIRPGRDRPGLLRAHVAAVSAAQAVCGAQVTGAEQGSTEVAFTPGEARPGDYSFGVGGAGSCLLVLQTVWPVLMGLAGPSRITLRGGTHIPNAPPFQFLQRAFAPLMDRLGATSDLRLRRHGFHPTGGGGVDFTLTPATDGRLQPFDLMERGPPDAAYAECLVAAVPRHVATRELDTLGKVLGWSVDQLHVPLVRQNEGPGNALMATLGHAFVTEVFTAVGEKGVSAETVARAVARDVRDYQATRGALGPFLADQWLLPLALAVWRSGTPARFTCTALSPRARAHIGLIERFLPCRFRVEPFDGGCTVFIDA
jgi:RNA 3'-terminal phosphate cyclase (ATP)